MPEGSSEQQQLRLLQAALDHINQGFTAFDGELRLVGRNKHFFDLLEFPEHLAEIGTHFSEFMRHNAERGEYGDGDVEALVAERVEKARSFHPHYLERTRPNGSVIAVKGDPLPGGGFVTTYTDITDQRQREEALEQAVAERTSDLRHSEERLRLITDAIPALIAYIDTRPCYTFANRRYASWFGLSVAAMQDRPVVEVLGESLFQELEPRIGRALNGEEVTYEYRRKGPSGAYADMRSTLLPDVDPAGIVRGCFVLSLDVTEQNQREAALRQSQKMEAIGQLTGGVAHDFNNLLTIILGNLKDVKARADDDEDLVELVEPAIEAANRGASLISRLLAFARGGAVDPRPIDVAATLNDLARLLRRSLPNSIEIVVQIKDAPRPTRVDRSQLENALLNLALNARDAMNGSGRILYAVGEERLEAERAAELELQPGDYVRIDVEDDGMGMSEVTRQRAFEPFYTTKAFGAGNGLGLSTVYGFARHASGTVALRSQPGDGCCITLYLPCADAAAADDAPAEAFEDLDEAPLAEGQGELVLLVEDDAAVRAVVRRQLIDLGFSVLETEDAEEALEMIRSVDEIRYLVSDIIMPGEMNGIALARQAKSITPTIKVGLISGFAQGQDREALAGCPFPVLPKPFATEALAGLIGRSA